MGSPFFRWAGGKRRLLKVIDRFLPEYLDTYAEPFLGAGAVLFHVMKKYPEAKFLCSDINPYLIAAYRDLMQRPDFLMGALEIYKKEHSKSFYYKIRGHIGGPITNASGAIFLYLQKAGFNGIWRVNSSGKFNVPFGQRQEINFDYSKLLDISKLLRRRKVKFFCQDYSKIFSQEEFVDRNTFLYVDPPYLTKTTKPSFRYANKLFGPNEWKELIEWVREQKCPYLISARKDQYIKDLCNKEKIWYARQWASVSPNPSTRATRDEMLIRSIDNDIE